MEKNFKFVTINFAKLNNFCGEIYKEIENNNFIDLINKDITKIKDEEIKIRLLLIGNSINFSFWEKSYDNTYNKDGFQGSMAMWHIVLTNPLFRTNEGLKDIVMNSFHNLFNEIPLSEERVSCLNEVLGFLTITKNLLGWIKQFSSARDLISNVIRSLPSFKDLQNGVHFNKRATCFAYMLKRYGILDDTYEFEETYILADYHIPKLFHENGVLLYSEELESKIRNNEELVENSIQEFEIRFSTVIVGIEILRILRKNNINIDSNTLDEVLWRMAKKIIKPYHLVRTLKY